MAVVVINVVTGIIMARTLGPAGRGGASAISLWPPVICGVLTLGIPVALRYHVRRKSDEPETLLSSAFPISLLLGAFAAVIGFEFIPHWLNRYPAPIIAFAQLMMLFSPLITLNTLLIAFLESRGEFAQSGSILYLPPVGTLLSLIVLFAFHDLTVFTVPLAYEVPFSIVTLITLYRVRRILRRPTAVVNSLRLLLGYGMRAYGTDILTTLSVQIGQIVVVGLLSAGSFGLYAVALNVSRTLLVIGTSMNTVLFPKATELNPDEAIALVARSARIVLVFVSIAAVVAITAMPIAVYAAFGHEYQGVVPVARVLTCEIILVATAGTLMQAFLATGRPGAVTLFQGVGLATSFPLMLLLIPKFGLIGAAYALLGSTSVRFCLILASFPVLLHRRTPRLLLTRDDMQFLQARIRRVTGHH